MTKKEELLKLIESSVQEYNKKKVSLEERVIDDTFPILWFGNVEKYLSSETRILTIGINPSDKEFERSGDDLLRFKKGDGSVNALYDAYNAYFDYHPYTKWFDSYNYQEGDRKIGVFKKFSFLDVDYGNHKETAKNIAIHVDYGTPIATDPTWSKLTKEEQTELLRNNHFGELLTVLEPKVLFMASNRENLEGLLGSSYIKDREMKCHYYGDNNRVSVYTDSDIYIIWTQNNSKPFMIEESKLASIAQEIHEQEFNKSIVENVPKKISQYSKYDSNAQLTTNFYFSKNYQSFIVHDNYIFKDDWEVSNGLKYWDDETRQVSKIELETQDNVNVEGGDINQDYIVIVTNNNEAVQVFNYLGEMITNIKLHLPEEDCFEGISLYDQDLYILTKKYLPERDGDDDFDSFEPYRYDFYKIVLDKVTSTVVNLADCELWLSDNSIVDIVGIGNIKSFQVDDRYVVFQASRCLENPEYDPEDLYGYEAKYIGAHDNYLFLIDTRTKQYNLISLKSLNIEYVDIFNHKIWTRNDEHIKKYDLEQLLNGKMIEEDDIDLRLVPSGASLTIGMLGNDVLVIQHECGRLYLVNNTGLIRKNGYVTSATYQILLITLRNIYWGYNYDDLYCFNRHTFIEESANMELIKDRFFNHA